MATYTAKIVQVQQTVWLLLAQQYNFTNSTAALTRPFEYYHYHFAPLNITVNSTKNLHMHTWATLRPAGANEQAPPAESLRDLREQSPRSC